MDETIYDNFGDLTSLAAATETGKSIDLNDFVPQVYAELRRLAAFYLKSERGDHTLQPTALVHEAFLRLAGTDTRWQNRNHFFALAAKLMRRILVDYARRHNAEKRGGAVKDFPGEPFFFVRERPREMIALDEALEELAKIDPRRARVVELRFFGGLDNDEIAAILGVHKNTVGRDWNLARAWLKTKL